MRKIRREMLSSRSGWWWLCVCRDACARSSLVIVSSESLVGRWAASAQGLICFWRCCQILSSLTDIFRLLTMFRRRRFDALLFLHSRRSRGCQRDVPHGTRQGCIRILVVNWLPYRCPLPESVRREFTGIKFLLLFWWLSRHCWENTENTQIAGMERLIYHGLDWLPNILSARSLFHQD